jgi:AcrR family transcriptional regulator
MNDIVLPCHLTFFINALRFATDTAHACSSPHRHNGNPATPHAFQKHVRISTIQVQPSKRMSPPPDKETQILDAAARRFAVYGPDKVTMDEIATDLGMGKASLYYYIPTKEELYRRVIRREQDQFHAQMQVILGSDNTASEKLRHYAARRLKYFENLVNLQLLNIMPWQSGKAVFKDQFESFAAEELKYLSEILRSGKKQGEFEFKSVEPLATLLLHSLQGLRLRSVKANQWTGWSAAESAELAREVGSFVEIFLAALRKTKSSARR